MSETFFGPWYIVLVRVDEKFSQSFTISGSENADGRYDVEFKGPLEFLVQGEEWRIQMEWLPIGPKTSWQSSDVRRTTKFVAGEGLIVQLDTDQFGSFFTLTCTSMDPEINPIPTGNPYDFTIPEN